MLDECVIKRSPGISFLRSFAKLPTVSAMSASIGAPICVRVIQGRSVNWHKGPKASPHRGLLHRLAQDDIRQSECDAQGYDKLQLRIPRLIADKHVVGSQQWQPFAMRFRDDSPHETAKMRRRNKD